MKVKVYAKLNISLNVVGKCDKFHMLDSIVSSIDIFDTVEVRARKDRIITVSGMNIPQEDNIAYKTANSFKKLFATSGVDIIIEKGIPFGAGLGGSSADAAGVVWCMCKLFKVSDPVKIKHLCSEMGSDVFFMLNGGLARMQEKGEKLSFAKQLPLFFALTNFDYLSNTANVFKEYDKLDTFGNIADVDLIWEQICEGRLAFDSLKLGNALQCACKNMSNYADRYIDFCNLQGYFPIMTGSGSSYFLPFNDFAKAQEICDALNKAGFNTILCKSTESGIEEFVC